MNRMKRKLRSLATVLATAGLLGSTFAVAGAGVASAAGPVCPITIHESGSTTVGPALVQAKPGFEAANGGCTLNIVQSGSGAGLSDLLASTVDIAASSRALNAGTEQTNLYSWLIGRDAMVIAVRGNATMNFINSITSVQVKDIWSGNITNWSSLGGPSAPIVPRSRATTSGSYSDLLSLFGITAANEASTISATGLARLQTSQDEATAACNNNFQIVYTSLANLQTFGPGGSDCLKALTLDGVNPSVVTVQNGTYPAKRQLFLAMRKNEFTGASPSDSAVVKAQDLVNYMRSSAGQAAVGAVGFVQVPVSSTKAVVDFDINTDGAVGLADIGQVTGKWAQSQPGCPGWIRADANNDGAVGLADIGAITGKWGGTGFVAP